jgi:hypothetical protein
MRIDSARLLIRVLASCAAIVFTCGFKYAYVTSGTTGLPLRWAPGPVPVRIMADNTTLLSDGTTRATAIETAMQDAVRGWNLHLGAVQFVPQILPAGSGVDGDGINQIFFAATPYNRSWEANTLALTTSWYVNDKRVESDIIFNSAVTWDSYRGAAKSSPVDLERVALHELGHMLGLDHPDTAGMTVQSIMNSDAVTYDQLQVYDVLAAQFLYGPTGVPYNDNFASATTISAQTVTATLNGYNTNATKETGEPNHGNNAGGRSVWWKWTPVSSGQLTLTTAGSAFDTTLGVYTGSAVSSLTTVATNDDAQPGVVRTSTVTFPAVAGVTYYIAVDGVNTGDGNGADSAGLTLNFSFANVYPVQGATITSGHNVTFTVNAGSNSVQWQVSTNGGTVWTNLADGGVYSGSTTASVTVTDVNSAMSGFQYRAIITDANGVSSTSGSGTLLVNPSFFSFPAGITIDALGNLYVSDSTLLVVQKITSASAISTLAGSSSANSASSTAGSTDGIGSAARFNQPTGLSASPAGVLGLSDTANATIRVIQPDGTVTTLAGSPTVRGNVDGTGSAATFSSPIGVARDAAGTLYVADSTNHTIRKVTSAGVVTTFAGTAGSAGSADGLGTAASFNFPTGIALDASGNVYVSDTTNNLVRKITPAGAVTTLAGVAGIVGSSDGIGGNALFNAPGGLAVDASGNIYLADTGNSTIRKITPANVVTTFAGLPGVAGLRDGSGSTAWFNQPKALTVDGSGNVWVADTGNAAIREITPAGVVSTLALVAATTTTTTSTTSTIPPTGGSSSNGGGGGAPSTWFLAALGLLAGLRRMLPRRR